MYQKSVLYPVSEKLHIACEMLGNDQTGARAEANRGDSESETESETSVRICVKIRIQGLQNA